MREYPAKDKNKTFQCLENWKELAAFVLEREGGYCNRKADKGGPTNKGVTLTTYRSVFGQNKTIEDLKRITDAEWEYIFKKFYWDKCKADYIQDKSVAFILVDWGYNSGVKTAVTHLQRIVKTTADGIMGKQTLQAVNTRSPLPLFGALKQDRIAFYRAIVAKNPSQKVFLKGWLNRVNHFAYGKFV